MRSKFTVLERRTMPMTVYPLERRNSARYEPSWPVTPVMSARFAIRSRLLDRHQRASAGSSHGRPYCVQVPTACMISFRLGGGDGVSVEAAKWAGALRTLGFVVRTVAETSPVDVVVRELAK